MRIRYNWREIISTGIVTAAAIGFAAILFYGA